MSLIEWIGIIVVTMVVAKLLDLWMFDGDDDINDEDWG